jgi:DNA-binding NarL/FixJ family response regulator
MLQLITLDDHPVIVEGIIGKFNQQHAMQVHCVLVRTAAALYEMLAKQAFEILILDLGLENQNGLDLIVPLKKQYPDMKILVFTSRNQQMVLSSVQAAGADGLVTKGEDMQQVVEAIKALAEGKKYYSTAVMQFFMNTDIKKFTLSPFEKDVLKVLKTVTTHKGIAVALKTDTTKIANTLKALHRKFGVNSTAELILEAQKQGFLD